MTARTCKCGCGTSLADRRQGTVWATASCESAFRRGVAPAQARKPRPGGLQVSYRKAVELGAFAIRTAMPGLPKDEATYLSEAWMKEGLSTRQRQRLENR